MLKDWATKHRHGTVNTTDLTAHAQQYAAAPLDSLFDAWLRKPSLPPLPHATGPHRPANPQTRRPADPQTNPLSRD